ncbi:hypothetical protein [Streptomyces sp. 4F14]|uniref:hypothetical protein n=1 Tax=Streptomyces sp. 4F14 TaxID=3394380 RepID=UPI003A8C171B
MATLCGTCDHKEADPRSSTIDAYYRLVSVRSGRVLDVNGFSAGVFRSTDQGATWLRVNDDAHQWGAIGGVGVITGDPDVFGRVYVGTNGPGLQYDGPS